MLSKKWYVAIAAAIRTDDILPLIHMMKRDNPRFDSATFRRACGKE